MNKKIAFIHSHDYYIEYTSEKWNRYNPLVLIKQEIYLSLSFSLFLSWKEINVLQLTMENSLKSVIWPLLRKETNALVKILRYSFCEKMK